MAKTKRPKLDYFPWWAEKYAAATTHLSKDADYAYRRILDHIFMRDQATCRVPNDDTLLMGVGRCSAKDWPAVRRALIDGPAPMLAKEGEGDEFLFSPFLREVIKEAKKKTRQARDAANTRWDSERNADGMRTHSERISGRNASQKSKSKEKEETTKTDDVVSLMAQPVEAGDTAAYLAAVARRVAPQLTVTDDWVRGLLQRSFVSYAVIAAAWINKRAHIAKARTPKYLEEVASTHGTELLSDLDERSAAEFVERYTGVTLKERKTA